MKKTTLMLLTLIITLSSLSIGTSAEEINNDILLASNQSIEYFSDGSYAVSTLVEESNNNLTRASSSKTASKSYSFYNSEHVLKWTVKLTGTFSYNGNTASCTASSVSSTIYDNAWRVASASASKSGATAIGDFTVKRYILLIPTQTEKVRLTITCSPNGTLS